MYKIALTGNIGSGKTVVSNIFKILSVPIFNADLSAKIFLDSNEVKSVLLEKFGKEIIGKSNSIDKEKFANIIFNNSENLEFTNSVIHPLVLADFDNWCKDYSTQSYVIMESAIIFESQLEKLFDKTIVIYCPEEIRINRVSKRDEINEEKVISRIKNQMSDSEKNKLADFIIQNDDLNLVIPQVIEIDKKLKNNFNSHVLGG
jgi:dephospho-CoA kinase